MQYSLDISYQTVNLIKIDGFQRRRKFEEKQIKLRIDEDCKMNLDWCRFKILPIFHIKARI